MRIISRAPKGKMLTAWATLFVAAVIMLSSTAVGFAETQNKVHAEGDIVITPALGVIVDSAGIDEENSSITLSPGAAPSFDININDLAYPGAYALARLTVVNKGDLPATLESIETKAPDAEFLTLSIADTLKPGDVISAGEACDFEVLIQWDADSTIVPEGEVISSFGLTLHYANNDYIVQSGGSSGPKTSDDTDPTMFFVLAGISAVAIIICLIFILRNKKKDKDNEN